jgi:histidinol dehydrogenase
MRSAGRPADPAGPVEFAAIGTVESLDARAERALFERGRATEPEVIESVARIVADVRQRGDAALRDLAERFDGVRPASLEVPRAEWARALESLEPPVAAALRMAAAAIARFHEAQLPAALEIETFPGVRLGRAAEPLERVGVYAPGGRAAYPSSVLMGVVPARAAGVGEVVVCSPPGPDGLPPAAVLAACALAGADRLFAVGGAGAIAAMAYGTDSIPRVDKIVGPGNAYVTEAKRRVNGTVATDSPAGPSEIVIVADATADARLAAVELIAQAEHDPDAAAVLVTTDAALLDAIRAEISDMIDSLPRASVVRASFASRGGLLLAKDLNAAVGFANRYAPEHLLLMLAEPRVVMQRIRNAGSVFLGAASSVAFGDYVTGANHVLPTNGLARSYAGLGTADFVRAFTWQELTPAGAAALSGATRILANAEGLAGHALAAALRGSANGNARGPDAMKETDPGAPASSEANRVGNAAAACGPRLRPAYAAVPRYDPGRHPVDVDLSDNTNLWGPCPAAMAALGTMRPERLTRYPSVYANELRRSIARLHGVREENVVTGCGSDDIIDSAVRAFAEPGATLAHPDPTFGMVASFARMNTVQPVAVPLGSGFALDVDALIERRAAITYLCSPNNPSGTVFPRHLLARLAREASGVVLLDEAYADFAGEDFLADAVASDRVLVLRTFSKAWGLAGLRVGYAIGPERLVTEVEKSRGPYKVGGVAEAAALAMLAAGSQWMHAHLAAARGARAVLEGRLAELGFKCFPSGANFVLVPLPAGTAADWNAALRSRGVAARPFSALRHAGECLRVTVGPEPMMQRFLAALAAVRTEMEGHE